ncbi:hypothetical protein N4R57_18065 [Rhodobacteraceae bacterium D3-12]|nr:hypothetical protein N4R57_18065 [Rhodobacteraceae bacterium D3-12]
MTLQKLFLGPPFRQLRSIKDYFNFFVITLSKRPKLTLAVYAIWIVTTLATAIFGPRVWSISPYWAFLIGVAGFFVKFVMSNSGANRVRALEISVNNDLSIRSQFLDPAPKDAREGFRNVRPPDGFDGAVHISDEINTKAFQQDDWDCPIVVDESNARQDSVVGRIRADARLFKAYGFQKTLGQFLKKPLINENKVGILTDFSVEMQNIQIFKTNYYSTLCAGEASLSDFSEKEGGVKTVVNRAATRVPFNLDGASATLNPLSAGRPHDKPSRRKPLGDYQGQLPRRVHSIQKRVARGGKADALGVGVGGLGRLR